MAELKILNIEIERNIDGPDLVKFHCEAPSGETLHLQKQVGRGDGEKYLETLGVGLSYTLVVHEIVASPRARSGRELKSSQKTLVTGS